MREKQLPFTTVRYVYKYKLSDITRMGALYRIYLLSARWGRILLAVVLVFTPIVFVIALVSNELAIPFHNLYLPLKYR
jgi:hypothetical protein